MILFCSNVLRIRSKIINNIRTATTVDSFYKVDVEKDTGIALLTMQKPPANTFSLEALQQFGETINQLKRDKVKGMILKSSMPKIFSAGLDLNEVYKPNPSRLADFWRQLQDSWLLIYTTPFPTAAAITGHAVAGGCLFSMACEYRVATKGNYKIGMNETAVGIFVPVWAQEVYRTLLSQRRAEKALSASEMFTSSQALQVGLVDEEVTDSEEAIEKCKQFILNFKNISEGARAKTKLIFRQTTVDKLNQHREIEIKMFVDSMLNPDVQETLQIYVDQLKNKSK